MCWCGLGSTGLGYNRLQVFVNTAGEPFARVKYDECLDQLNDCRFLIALFTLVIWLSLNMRKIIRNGTFLYDVSDL
jgi:hypothetical protein